MWWFLNKSSQRIASAGESVRKHAEEGLLGLVPDLSRLDSPNVAIKIWLPERIAQTMKWLADYEGVSQSNWVRSQLTSYVYGHVAVLAQKIRDEQNRVLFSRASVDRNAGRWVYLVPQLGKNTVAFKLWVSKQLRDDLAILADHAKVALSPFVREAIIGALLGRGSLPERPAIMGLPSTAALAWERDEQVDINQIEESEFNGLGDAEKVWLENENPVDLN